MSAAILLASCANFDDLEPQGGTLLSSQVKTAMNMYRHEAMRPSTECTPSSEHRSVYSEVEKTAVRMISDS